ncbi:MAG: TetR/AcrR family transcriptional regulator [Halanaerobiales bacterium]
MVRISKDPDVRMNEILDAAEKLFAEKGYDNTTVGSIVEEVGVAKGTFYYYFDTKESIITALVERQLLEGKKQADQIVESSQLNAVEKMAKIMNMLLVPPTEEQGVFHCMDSDSNAKIHQKRDELFHKLFKGIILRVVGEGVQKGYFQCEYYQDITEIIFIGIDKFMHINMKNFKDKDQEFFHSKIMAIQELLERVLGIEKGKLDILGENIDKGD